MNLSPEVEALLVKARHALGVAEKLRNGGDFPDAASKAYYAMFYAAQDLLKSHGIEVVKHSAVASMLGRQFAKTGRLDPKFHRMFLNSQRVRETADYGIFQEVTELAADVAVEEGRAFLTEITRILQENKIT
ncbi:MAG: HEPN domain-containing protein [Desulfobaccales bacterium]